MVADVWSDANHMLSSIKSSEVHNRLVSHYDLFDPLWKTGKIKRKSKYNNLIVTVCKTMIAKRLAGEGNDCNITYGAVGTNATAPAASDTTLGTELARKVVASLANNSISEYVVG